MQRGPSTFLGHQMNARDPRWSELFALIADLTDEELLRVRWAGLMPQVAASPTEDVALIFDSLGIDEAIRRAPDELGLTKHQHDLLAAFRDCLNVFVDLQQRPWPSYETIIRRAEWRQVMAAARDFIDALQSRNA
jgi:hypothetical protein